MFRSVRALKSTTFTGIPKKQTGVLLVSEECGPVLL